MIYKSKKTAAIIYFFVLIGFLYFSYNINEFGWRIFCLVFGVWASIMYIFAVFEYYKVDETKIIHVYRLGLKKDEVLWKDICRVYVFGTGFFKAIRIDYGMFGENDMIINTEIKGYKQLVKTILHNTENNPDVSIDIRLDDFLNS